MNVEELIAELSGIKDKKREVAFCILSTVVDIDCKESDEGPVLLYVE